MKKYVKPELFYEHFELSQHIADCAWFLTLPDEDSCRAKPDSSMPNQPALFWNDALKCEATPDVIEDFCYQPGTSSNLFAS